jgi:hypothetical protein
MTHAPRRQTTLTTRQQLIRGYRAVLVLFYVRVVPQLMGVRVPGAARGQVRFQRNYGQDGDHGNQAGKGCVALAEERWETWVREGNEGRREQVDEGRGHEHAGAEVLADEDDGARFAAF